MSVDGQIAIIGNGNMDSQSWFHSQVNKQQKFFFKEKFERFFFSNRKPML